MSDVHTGLARMVEKSMDARFHGVDSDGYYIFECDHEYLVKLSVEEMLAEVGL